MDRVTDYTYVAVGHVCWDKLESGLVPGGTVTFAGRWVEQAGYETAILTSAASTYPFPTILPNITVQNVAAAETTTFENQYIEQGRRQYLFRRADDLESASWPQGWEKIPVRHIGPIANEVAVDMVVASEEILVGVTPQGWLRQWDETGLIRSRRWELASWVLRRATAVILSDEDITDPALWAQYRQWANILVMTQGEKGCTVWFNGEQREFPAPKVVVANLTGAGDIFAAAFFLNLYESKNPWLAAEQANQQAAYSVSQDSLAAKTDQAVVLKKMR
ncbi:MAG TPA: PfkB family carbohydrate kinase [Anaerolineae bacterium]|nr:PfkB family carbohydrate kinase [Anaerolineae bacterium]